MTRWLASIAAVVLFVGSAHGAEPPLRVLVDGSGSMRGFVTSGALDDLVRRVEASGAAAGWNTGTRVFHAETAQEMDLSGWAEWRNDPTWGEATPLVRALTTGLQGARGLVLVTDNFQDPAGSGEAEGVAEVYAALREAGIHRAYFVPELLEFDGNVDLGSSKRTPAGARPADLLTQMKEDTDPRFVGQIGSPRWVELPDGRAFWKTPYKGKRGLAVYLILMDSALGAEFEALASSLTESRNLPALLVWPLAGDAVGLRGSDAPADPRGLECVGLSSSDLPAPNLVLEAMPNGRYGLRPRPDMVYDPRRPGRFVASIEPYSTEGHVSLRHQASGCDSTTSLTVGDLEVRAASGDEGVLLPLKGGHAGTVLPPRLLSPIRALGEGSGQSVFVTFDVPPLVGPKVPDERIDGQVSASFDLRVQLAPGSVGLDDRVRRRFFTSKTTDLARIYSPEDLIRRLAGDGLDIAIPVQLPAEVFFRPPPPAPPRAAFPWAPMLALLGLLGGFWVAVRPLGFHAALYWTGGARALGVPVGGLVKTVESKHRLLNVGGSRTLQVRRESWWGRTLLLLDETQLVGHLRRGGSLPVPGSEEQVEWLTAGRVSEFQSRGAYDEVAG